MRFYLLVSCLLSMILTGCSEQSDSVNSPDSTGSTDSTEAEPPILGAAVGDLGEIGRWGEVIDWPFIPVSIANLPDGRILSYSGSERRSWPTAERTYTATFDPVTGQFEEELFQGHNMFCAALTMKADGEVMVNGGRNAGNSPWTSVFDYRDNSWSQIENMASGGRWYPTSLAMGDGSILTAMGNATNVRNPDLWHDDEGWRVLNGIDFLTMRSGRNGGDNNFPLMSVSPDGNIFHYWDPERNHFLNAGGNGEFRDANADSDGGQHPAGVQLMYDIGKLIIVGSADGSWNGRPTNNAFTIDLNTPVPEIRSTSNIASPRKFQMLVPLPTGEVMVVGGNTTGTKYKDGGSVMAPEIWNPETGQWRQGANMSVPRNYHSTALLLNDGRVFTGGGGYQSSGRATNHLNAQIYSPYYLFSGNQEAVRPTISSTEETVETGDWIDVTTSGDVSSFSFIRMGTSTHGYNHDARFYRPEFEDLGNGRFRVRAHENPHISIPGYWMLFALNDAGVPSVSLAVQITAVDTRLENLAIQGTASQSSTLNDDDRNAAIHAVDGNLSGNTQVTSISQTAEQAQPWWQLDLGRVKTIERVRLWNRTDCCSDELVDVRVLVSNDPIPESLSDAENTAGLNVYRIDGIADWQTDIPIDANGRYVRVQLAGTGSLQLAEVQVFGQARTDLSNLALSGVVSQSSNFDDSPVWGADEAIDGQSDGNASSSTESYGGDGGSAFDTRCPTGQVLTGVYGNASNTVNRIGPICVAADDSGNWTGNPTPGSLNGPVNGADFSRSCPVNYAVSAITMRTGRAVDKLTLHCNRLINQTTIAGEDQRIDSVGGNGGSTKPTLRCGGGAAATGIFGRAGGKNRVDRLGLHCLPAYETITQTSNELQPWWEVDLGALSEIDSVVLWNRTDCCSDQLANFAVLVSEEPFVSDDLNTASNQPGVSAFNQISNDGARTEIVVGGLSARYVRVQLAGSGTLSLAEVDVLGLAQSNLTVAQVSSTPRQSNTSVTYTASAAGTGSLSYSWTFGDGTPSTPFSNSAVISHTYTDPGRYTVIVTVRDSKGNEVREQFSQLVHDPLQASGVQSSNLLEIPSAQQLWNTNPDNGSVSVLSTISNTLIAEIPVGDDPVALAMGPDNRVWVVNRHSATISVIDPLQLNLDGAYTLPAASQPYGMVVVDDAVYVALQGTGEIIQLDANGAAQMKVSVGDNPRHLTYDPNSNQLYVSRFITPSLPDEDTASPIVEDGTRAYGGEVLVLNADDLSLIDTIILEHLDIEPSEHTGPGVPNYIGALVLSPAGGDAWVPSKQDNILGGQFRGGTMLTFDNTVRAVTSRVDLNLNVDKTDQRVDHDNASVAHSAVFDPYGATVFVTLEGNRQVALIDSGTGIEFARFDTGLAPQNLLLSADGDRLYVHNYMDRSISIYDVEDIVMNGGTMAFDIATISVVSNEQLNPVVLRGKQLFHDARDDRLAGLDYMSCASCHVDGEHDGRIWDFTALGEGLRNTTTLIGRAGMGHGLLHWTGNFDEVQDFEGQIREFAGGNGLMTDADFSATEDPLGAPKAGLSEDLDALAAYLASLDGFSDSPYGNTDNSLSDDALAGQALFESNNCAACHRDAIFTDSPDGVLHDIGSIMPSSGTRLGVSLTGLDTPTLLGVWRTAPYLHDGSAATLQEAISAHVSLTFTQAELDQIAAYLRQLDGNSDNSNPQPPEPPVTNESLTNAVAAGALLVDGDVSDWDGLRAYDTDPADMPAGNPIDWTGAAAAHDGSRLYLTFSAAVPVTGSWGYGIYIDTDNDRSTGFTGFADELPIGADYLIESIDVQRHTGQSNQWAWESVGIAQRAISGNQAELSVLRLLLGNPQTLRMVLIGNNFAEGGIEIDYYPDNAIDDAAAAETRYLGYRIDDPVINSAPTALAQTLSVAAGGSTQITLTGQDIDNDPLSFSLTDQPTHGSLSGTPPNVSYTPDDNYTGSDTFSFVVSDGRVTSNPATISIAVVGAPPNNEASIVVDGSLAEWQSLRSFGLDAADANALNDTIDWQYGWMAHDSNNLYIAYQSYDDVTDVWGFAVYLDTDNNRTTGFTGFAGELPIGVDVVIENSTYLTYTGTGSNWSWREEGFLPFTRSGNQAELSIELAEIGNPDRIQLYFRGDNAAVNGSTVDFYPDGVVDAAAEVRYHSYIVNAQSANRPPVAISLSPFTLVDTAVELELAGYDPEGTPLTYAIASEPANGSLSGTAPNLTYTPSAGFEGTDSFSFQVNDGQLSSTAALVEIEVRDTPPGEYAVSNGDATIVIDGNLSEWQGLSPYVPDTQDPADIDFRQVWMANNADNLYLAWEQTASLTRPTWGHQIYLDTDQDRTTGFRGFGDAFSIGADYILEGIDLFRYTGTGNNWSWEYIGAVGHANAANTAEFVIPLTTLGSPVAIDFILFGNSVAVGGTAADYYPNEATDNTQSVDVRHFLYSVDN